MRCSGFPAPEMQSGDHFVPSERRGEDAGRQFRILLCRHWLATSSPSLTPPFTPPLGRRRERCFLPLEFPALHGCRAEVPASCRAGLADSRPLQRWQLPDVPLGPRSARVTWGHALPCRPAPGASAAAAAARSSSELLAARVSTQATAATFSVPIWPLQSSGF